MKKTSNITKEKLIPRLKNMSINYLGRYSSSSNNLKKYLTRKIKEYNKDELSENPDKIIIFTECIDETIDFLEKLGYLNDQLYAKTQLRSLLNKGKSTRLINLKLQEKGLEKEDISTLMSNNDKYQIELYSALKFIRKKSFGAYRKIKLNEFNEEVIDDKKKEKEYASIFRNGFSYDIINKVMNIDKEEAEDLLYQLEKEIDL